MYKLYFWANLQDIANGAMDVSVSVCESFPVSVTIMSTGHTLAKIRNVKMTFEDSDIRYLVASLSKLYSVTVIDLLRVRDKKIHYIWSVKMCGSSFLDVDICHRTVSLRKSFSMTLIYFVKLWKLEMFIWVRAIERMCGRL